MKTRFAILLLGFVLGLVGCSDKPEPTKSNENLKKPKEVPTKDKGTEPPPPLPPP